MGAEEPVTPTAPCRPAMSPSASGPRRAEPEEEAPAREPDPDADAPAPFPAFGDSDVWSKTVRRARRAVADEVRRLLPAAGSLHGPISAQQVEALLGSSAAAERAPGLLPSALFSLIASLVCLQLARRSAARRVDALLAAPRRVSLPAARGAWAADVIAAGAGAGSAASRTETAVRAALAGPGGVLVVVAGVQRPEGDGGARSRLARWRVAPEGLGPEALRSLERAARVPFATAAPQSRLVLSTHLLVPPVPRGPSRSSADEAQAKARTTTPGRTPSSPLAVLAVAFASDATIATLTQAGTLVSVPAKTRSRRKGAGGELAVHDLSAALEGEGVSSGVAGGGVALPPSQTIPWAPSRVRADLPPPADPRAGRRGATLAMSASRGLAAIFASTKVRLARKRGRAHREPEASQIQLLWTHANAHMNMQLHDSTPSARACNSASPALPLCDVARCCCSRVPRLVHPLLLRLAFAGSRFARHGCRRRRGRRRR